MSNTRRTILVVSTVEQQRKAKIRIVFLCGSIEPGCDGVGDYTRKLASELIRQGHQASVVALNDKFLNDVTKETQTCCGRDISVLRIPTGSDQKTVSGLLRSFVKEHNADWLSLQFVPFAFHPKGLPFGLKKMLAPVAGRYKLHIMFHELWVAMEKSASPAYTLWGWLQYRLIRKLVQSLKPGVVHTHCGLYRAHLERFYGRVQVLPLFSNVDLPESSSFQQDQKPCNSFQEIVAVVFGSIHHSAPIVNFAAELKSWAAIAGRPLRILFVGRNGNELAQWTEAFQRVNAQFEVLGERSSQEIAKILHNATLGLTSTPFHLIEKSGTVAAMLEHGLPVICVARSWGPKLKYAVTRIPNVIEYKKGELAKYLAAHKLLPYQYSASVAADAFVTSLINVK